MATAHIGEVQLHYRFDGPADAPVVMLSNSLGTDLGLWDGQVAALAKRYRVLRYDMRGHGGSSVPAGPYSVERLGHDVLALLDALDLTQVHFCGLSLGGMVGMWLGTHAAQRLRRLVLCSTATRIGPPDIWAARIAAVEQGGMAAIASSVLERWFTPNFRTRSLAAVERVRDMLLGTKPEGYIAACMAVRDTDQRESVKQVRTPTLVMAGTFDPATPPAEGRTIAQCIPGARYVELPAAHLSNIEAQADFNAALLRFLEE